MLKPQIIPSFTHAFTHDLPTSVMTEDVARAYTHVSYACLLHMSPTHVYTPVHTHVRTHVHTHVYTHELPTGAMAEDVARGFLLLAKHHAAIPHRSVLIGMCGCMFADIRVDVRHASRQMC